MLCTAAKLIMYHGTSAQHLRSILKHGLRTEPGHRRFTEKDDTAQTYGGAYMTPQIETALQYASRWSREDDTDSVLVIAQIETRTEYIVPDEDVFIAATDPFTHEIAQSLGKTMGWSGAAGGLDLLFQEQLGRLDLSGWVEPWIDNMNKWERNIPLDKSLLLRHKKDLTDLLRQVIRIQTVRYPASRPEHQHARDDLDLGSRAEERAKFIQMLNSFSRKIQRLTDPHARLRIRSLQDIGYRGANRIVGILRYRYPDTGVQEGEVVFSGDPVEVNRVVQYLSGRAKTSTWTDARGNVIVDKQQKAAKVLYRGAVYREADYRRFTDPNELVHVCMDCKQIIDQHHNATGQYPEPDDILSHGFCVECFVDRYGFDPHEEE